MDDALTTLFRQTRPLDGIRVVEAGRYAAGPACATILADWGADVVKLEPPGGDPARGPGSTNGHDGAAVNPRFELHNRSRRSLAIDLGTDEGRALAHELIAAADVFVTNLRPAALARLGIDEPALRRDHDALIYAQITGYGLGTAAQDDRSFDHGAFWAFSGMGATFADATGAPPQPAGGMGDRSAALALAGAIAAALFARTRNGQGAHVSTSLLATGVWLLGSDASEHLAGAEPVRRSERRQNRYPTLNCFQAGDGRWFWLQIMLPEQDWPSLVKALDAPWLDEHPDFGCGSAAMLAQAAPEITEVLDEIFRLRTRSEWLERLRGHGLAAAPVQTLGEAVTDPVTQASGAVTHRTDRAGVMSAVVATPGRFESDSPATVGTAPLVGEHTDEILAELGVAPARIAALRAAGIVAGAAPSPVAAATS